MTEVPVVDDLAAERAFRRHYREIYRYVRRRTRSDEAAQEVTQEVFADAAAALDCIDHRRGWAGWLYTVARRRLADRARSAARAPAQLVPLERARNEVAAPEEYGPEVGRALRVALLRVPEQQRRVIVMKILEGRSFADIADRLDATPAACKMRFVRGLRTLRHELEKEGIE